ncbi:MAG: alpha/beta fold hydrolase [Clostridiales bacterium]|nr:alpha/beta fold hydrolase [Clostridiales bacterium]
MKRKLLIVIPIIFLLLVFNLLFNSSYKATDNALNALESTDTLKFYSDDYISFIPISHNEIGIIMYPGGKVEHEAYAPLMRDLADQGYSTFIAKMPLDLAIFGKNKASEIIEENNTINQWYIMGHSLGGVMAAQYAYENQETISGLILLASYPQEKHDFSNTDMEVLSILGNLDGLIDLDTYKETKAFLPEDTMYITIDGGNHAQMGTYGKQKKDLPATLTPEEQEYLIIESIMEFIH